MYCFAFVCVLTCSRRKHANEQLQVVVLARVVVAWKRLLTFLFHVSLAAIQSRSVVVLHIKATYTTPPYCAPLPACMGILLISQVPPLCSLLDTIARRSDVLRACICPFLGNLFICVESIVFESLSTLRSARQHLF